MGNSVEKFQNSQWQKLNTLNFSKRAILSLPARLQILLGQVPENNTARDGHVYWMTWKVITDLLKKAGFEVQETVFNTFWETVPGVGAVMNQLKKMWPSLFALSFIIKARKVSK